MPPLKDYSCKVGVIFLGGCGTNTARRIVDQLDPAKYPDFSLLVANTDAKVQKRHFGNSDNAQQKLWTDARALTLHQLGGERITKGRGAGAKPEVGRQATADEESMKVIRDFFEANDEILIVLGLGGGTGTGAGMLVAELAKELLKPTLALVVIPDPKDGRTKRATDALNHIQALVPTIPIQNAYLDEMMSEMSEEESDKLTYEDSWRIVNENSLIPMLLVIREIIQVTGDIVNLDQADWETMLSYGNQVFFGLCRVDPEKIKEAVAEKIATKLLAGRFQDTSIIPQSKVIGLWAHGPWGKKKADAVRDLVRKKVANDDPQEELKLEVHRGIVHHVDDNEMWMGLILVAPTPGEAKPSTALPGQRPFTLKGIEGKKSDPDTRPVKRADVGQIRFRSNGEWTRILDVSRSLESRFNRMMRDEQLPWEEVEPILLEVKKETGIMPDTPERFLVTEETREKEPLRNIFVRALLPRKI